MLLDIVLHLDTHLLSLIQQYGDWVYAILFLIIFAETGLVIAPFLPGDSLLFVAGALCGMGSMELHILMPLLMLAAFFGGSLMDRWNRQASMVGADLALSIHDYLFPYLEDAKKASPALREKVAAGDLGFKSGKGFQTWTDEQKDASRRKLNAHLIQMLYGK